MKSKQFDEGAEAGWWQLLYLRRPSMPRSNTNNRSRCGPPGRQPICQVGRAKLGYSNDVSAKHRSATRYSFYAIGATFVRFYSMVLGRTVWFRGQLREG